MKVMHQRTLFFSRLAMCQVTKWKPLRPRESALVNTVEPIYSGHHRGMNLIEGWPYLRGWFALKECIWDSAKWPFIEGCPHVRGGLYEGFHCRCLDQFDYPAPLASSYLNGILIGRYSEVGELWSADRCWNVNRHANFGDLKLNRQLEKHQIKVTAKNRVLYSSCIYTALLRPIFTQKLHEWHWKKKTDMLHKIRTHICSYVNLQGFI